MKIDLTQIKTYYISLDSAIDRQNAIEGWHKSLGFMNPVRIPGVINDLYYVGLCQATNNAIKVASLEGMPFLIFEDDAMPTNKIISEVEIPDDADALYLGIGEWGMQDNGETKHHNVILEKVNGYPEIFKIKNALCTHAIVYITSEFASAVAESTRKCFEDVPEYPDQQIYKDGIFDNFNVYVVGPLFYQHDESKPSNLIETRDIELARYTR